VEPDAEVTSEPILRVSEEVRSYPFRVAGAVEDHDGIPVDPGPRPRRDQGEEVADGLVEPLLAPLRRQVNLAFMLVRLKGACVVKHAHRHDSLAPLELPFDQLRQGPSSDVAPGELPRVVMVRVIHPRQAPVD
jgi:hypothetical protein